ncbi:MAG: hypothetical protein AB9M53_07640 [Leptothrix sp. (in: b-proteobacteria)]
MHHNIDLLSNISYQVGIIGITEYRERHEIAHWLSADGESHHDPRTGRNGELKRPREVEERLENDGTRREGVLGSANTTDEDTSDRWLHFLALNKWIFTVGDRDCYPSVPHGHLQRKNNEWPKLNPYTGRVFVDVHDEDVPSRLTKSEMKALWRDDGFLEHCRRQVLWYSDFAQDYAFPNASLGRLRFPKW